MPTIKIYPPSQLPDRDVSETQFNIWVEELEVYLSQEKNYEVFLKGGLYESWESFENNENRIPEVKPDDQTQPANRDDPVAVEAARQANETKLKTYRKDLRTVLSIIGKCVPEGQYSSVVRHSTSLQWIYDSLRTDFDIQKKGIHFFNILDIKYDGSKMTPISFYNQYRTLIVNNLGKNGDIIKYKNNEALAGDEKMTPMLEDVLLLNVIHEIDPRLPAFIKTHYNHKMRRDDRLMDFKADIMVNINSFLEQLNSVEQVNSFKEDASASLHAFKQTKAKAAQPKKKQKFYCRLCHNSKMPREVFLGHNMGDPKCTQMSYTDRARLIESLKLSNIKEEEDFEDEDEIAEMFGYSSNSNSPETVQNEEVNVNNSINSSSTTLSRSIEEKYSYIKPVQSQILTLYQDSANKVPIHVDLDSGATVNYCMESEVLKCGFKVYPNGQLSKLGDGHTKIKACGEIHETFFRNSWQVKYSAIVAKQLSSPFIGGTVFLKENGIEQDFNKNVIHIFNRQFTVQPTDPLALLPTAPILGSSPQSSPSKVKQDVPNKLHTFKSRTLLPGQCQDIPVHEEDGTIVAIEPFEQNNNSEWPEPRLQAVENGKIVLNNNTNDAITLGKDVKQCRIRHTHDENVNPDDDFYKYSPSLSSIAQDDNISLVNQGKMSEKAKEIINNAHKQFASVFDKDLSHGYNGFYGNHKCSLNWASKERPQATKVKVPSYDHNLKGLQQEVMDDLTSQGVLLIPQDHGIKVQSVCPSFLQRKQRARDKPKHALTKSDVRLLINFGPVNDKIKPVPIHTPKTDDILIMIGRWKHLIIFDLFNGYFQNHMSEDSIQWLGVQTPFGGLRVMARSGQGLMGMAEEFDELMAKILKQELQDGICAKIVDDIVVGGNDQEEAATNYFRVLSKLSKANIKVTPEKTHIFPDTADMLGWKWKQGGFLEASPHRKFALSNTKIEDIRKVHDMRSWVGLFKTLHIVTPRISEILSPFEQATAGKDSKDDFQWTHELQSKFREAKNGIEKLVTLFLPSPEDQLIMETDASKGGGKNNLPAGIGHILFVLKDGQKLPVRIHSTKLPDKCKKWQACEIETLAFAVGIDKEYDLIRESKHPLIICTDSKPVHQAVKLINSGKFSTSARMSSFLTNVNRTRIETRHISGKARLNPLSDLQSRSPAECDSEYCSVHKFIKDAIDSVVDEGAKNCKVIEIGFANREAWRNCQEANQACKTAKKLLTSGKPPPKAIGKTAGEYWNDVRQYCRDASIAKDGLLVVKSKPEALSGNIARERIVIPKPLVPALLYHLHNHDEQHPVKSQQKSSFQRQFYAIHLENHLELLYKNCYQCSVIQKIPKTIIPNETKTQVNGPQTHFHADIIKRANQNILILVDHFSSFQDATLIDSEKAVDLKEGLISLSSAMRRPGEIFISVDNAPGFKPLLSNSDNDLKKLHIVFVKTDEVNKNSNAVVDKGCQELEDELKRLQPEGNKINLSTLKLALLNLNSKLRRRGNISAYEINSSRDQNTGDNMNLDDEALRKDQLDKRTEKREVKPVKEVKVGDTVRIRNKSDKHKANDMFLVTSKEDENIEVQKLLHPLKNTPTKLMSKVYKTTQKHLVTIHRPEYPTEMLNDEENESEEVEIENKTHAWKPINDKFFYDVDSDDEEEHDEQLHNENDDISSSVAEVNEPDLQWDSSPEQYALLQDQHLSSDDPDLANVLAPCRLFAETDDNVEEDLTPIPSTDEEVFTRDSFQTPPSAPKLPRRNAMLQRYKPKANSEPRITRTLLNSDRYQFLSNPTSPSQVILDVRQNLENVFNPRAPLVADNVSLDNRVQMLDHVLDDLNSPPRRRSARDIPKVDYKVLHNFGRTK